MAVRFTSVVACTSLFAWFVLKIHFRPGVPPLGVAAFAFLGFAGSVFVLFSPYSWMALSPSRDLDERQHKERTTALSISFVLLGAAIIAGLFFIEPMCLRSGVPLTAKIYEHYMTVLFFFLLALPGSVLAHLQPLPPADAFAAD